MHVPYPFRFQVLLCAVDCVAKMTYVMHNALTIPNEYISDPDFLDYMFGIVSMFDATRDKRRFMYYTPRRTYWIDRGPYGSWILNDELTWLGLYENTENYDSDSDPEFTALCWSNARRQYWTSDEWNQGQRHWHCR